ncbi:MAG: MBL fold metallo-hydrolase [Syntrophomonadaceae bacterium]|nr:MBL fold metallo-hydrolase [Syntrophomonadaceae bacterium]MDD3023774.1 MBL fold metallo-hydrolase [Syntrophomonadaceae bacterium]
MDLRHLSGNTYAIESNNTSLGLYVFKDGRCLLIDSGANQNQAQELLQILDSKGWSVYAICNTHAHADHCGGNHYIQEKSHCRIYASELEAAFINNPILTPYAMYSAYPLKLLTAKFLMPQASRVSHIIKAGPVRINAKRFIVLDLAGHSLGQMGIITPDGVLFAGDALIAPEILTDNPFLYLAHPDKQNGTIETIKAARFIKLYLSHGGLIADVSAVLKANEEMFITVVNSIKEMIKEPRSPEAIIVEVINRQGLQVNRNHYFRLECSVMAFLAYLCDSGQAKIYVENNLLRYCARS